MSKRKIKVLSLYNVRLTRLMSKSGLFVTIACPEYDFKTDVIQLETTLSHYASIGILVDTQSLNFTDFLMANVKHMDSRNIFLLTIAEKDSKSIRGTILAKKIRFDADVSVAYSLTNYSEEENKDFVIVQLAISANRDVTRYVCGSWADDNFKTSPREILSSKLNLEKAKVIIITPDSGFSLQSGFNGTLTQFLETEERWPEHASATRTAHNIMRLILEGLNATIFVEEVKYWSRNTADGMLGAVAASDTHVSGSVLRMSPQRHAIVDFVLPVWPFRVGFTLVSEREGGERNMFLAPLGLSAWLAVLSAVALLAGALALTASSHTERRSAVFTAVAACLQQDTDTKPSRGSGRVTFIVLSVTAMVVHAYYTSAVVSALLDEPRGGPASVRALADSTLRLYSQPIDYMREQFFENPAQKWRDMEYLVQKKISRNSKFYLSIDEGVDMIRRGGVAYHTEYNSIYRQLSRNLPDHLLCRIRQIDTIPQINSYLTTAKNSPYLNSLRVMGLRVMETGLVSRNVAKWKAKLPVCHAALIAEPAGLTDIMPALKVTVSGISIAFAVFLLEHIYIMLSSQQKFSLT